MKNNLILLTAALLFLGLCVRPAFALVSATGDNSKTLTEKPANCDEEWEEDDDDEEDERERNEEEEDAAALTANNINPMRWNELCVEHTNDAALVDTDGDMVLNAWEKFAFDEKREYDRELNKSIGGDDEEDDHSEDRDEEWEEDEEQD